MKISELVEATISPQPPGQPSGDNPTEPTEGPPNTSNTPQTPAPTGQPTQAGQQTIPSTGQQQPADTQVPNPNTPQVGKPMGTAPGAPSTVSTPNVQQQSPVQQKDIDDIKTKITQLQGLLAKSQQTQQPGSQPAAQQQPKLGGY
jgi:hypothetical protein